MAWYENNHQNFKKFNVNKNLQDVWDVDAFDADNDGDLDLVSISRENGECYFHENENLNFTTSIIVDSLGTPFEMDFGDLNNNGYTELFIAGRTMPEIAHLEYNGTTWLSNKIRFGAKDFNNIQLVDVENDGDLDLLLKEYSSKSFHFYQNNGDGNFENTPHIFGDYGWGKSQLFDFDLDGKKDLIFSDYKGKKVHFLKNDSNGQFIEQAFIDTLDTPAAIVLNDFDNDGDPDMLVSSSYDGAIYLYRSNLIRNYSISELWHQMMRVEFLPYTILTIIALSLLIFLILFRNKKLIIRVQNKSKTKLDEMEYKLQRKNLQIIRTHEHIKKLKNHIENINLQAQEASDSKLLEFETQQTNVWSEFMISIESLHPNFWNNLKTYKLTHTDKRLISLLRLNLSVKECAKLLNVSERTVYTSRYRIKKKLSLTKEDDLEVWVNNL